MSKHSIKTVLLFLALCLLFTSFTGCELSKKLINDPGEGKKLKQAKLTFYFPKMDDKIKKQAVKTVTNKIEDESFDKLNVKLDFRWAEVGIGPQYSEDYGLMNPGGVYSEYINDIIRKIKSGETLDAFFVRNDYGIKKLADEQLIKNLSNLLPDYGDKLSKNYKGSDLAAYTYNGILTMVPNLMPVSQRLYAVVRKDMLKKYGINKIEVLEDLDKYLGAVKENEKSYIPLYPFWFFHGSTELMPLIEFFTGYMGYEGRIPYYYKDSKIFGENLGVGYRWDDPQTKLVPLEQTREFKDTFYLIKKWYDKEYIYKRPEYAEKPYAASIVTMDEMLAYSKEIKRCITQVGTQEELEFFPLYPKLPVRKSYYHETGIAISKNSRNPERVMMFLNWIQSSQENYNLFMYGVEGANYKKIGKKIRVVSDQDADNYKDRYFPWVGYSAFMNKDYIQPFKGDNFDLSSLCKKSLKMLVRNPPTVGFSCDMGILQDMVLSRINTAVFNYSREIKYSETFLNDYINAQKSAGADVLAKTLQEQLDKWKKEQLKK